MAVWNQHRRNLRFGHWAVWCLVMLIATACASEINLIDPGDIQTQAVADERTRVAVMASDISPEGTTTPEITETAEPTIPSVTDTPTATTTPEPTDTLTPTERPTNTATASPTATLTLEPTQESTTESVLLAVAQTRNLLTNANVRSCPELRCDIVQVLTQGEQVRVIGEAEGDRVGDSTTWNVVLVDDDTEAYVHGSVLSAEVQAIEPFRVVTRANARSCAGFSCPVVVTFSVDAILDVVGTQDGDEFNNSVQWNMILYENQTLYIHNSVLESVNPTATPEPAFEVEELLATAQADEESVSVDAETYLVINEARVRSCPRLDCEILETLEEGSEISVIGEDNGAPIQGDANWYIVLFDEEEAYVHTSSLELLVEAEATAESTSEPTEDEQFTLRERANLRTCASTDCGVAAIAEVGTILEVIGEQEGEFFAGTNVWNLVRFDDRDVYVHSSVLVPVSELSDVSDDAETEDGYRVIDPPLTYYMRVQADVRECARRDCNVVATLESGTPLRVVGEVQGDVITNDARWWVVDLSGRQVFIPNAILSPTNPAG